MEKEDLLKKIEVLEKEVRDLKENQDLLIKHTGFKKVQNPVIKKDVIENATVPKSTTVTEVRKPNPVEPKTTPKIEEKAVKAKEPFDFEKVLGIWLPRVFMLILLLGVLWGLKLGIDYGFITPIVRVAGGYLVSGLLAFYGVKFIKNSRRAFGLTLLGGYIAIGILITFSAYELYHFIGYYPAMIISLLIIANGIYFSAKFKSEVIIIYSIIGSMLLPFIIQSEAVGTGLIFPYLTIMFSIIYIAALLFGHKYSYYIAFIAYHISMLIPINMLSDSIESQEHMIVTSFIVQHLVVLGFFLFKEFANKAFSETLIYTSVVSLISIVALINYSYMDVVFIALALVYVLVGVRYFKENKKYFFIASSTATVLLASFMISFLDGGFHTLAISLLVTSTVGLLVGIKFKDARNIVVSGSLYLWSSLVAFFATWPNGLFGEETILIVLANTSIVYLFVFICKKTNFSKKATSLFAIPFLYVLVSSLKVLFELVSFTSIQLSDTMLDFLQDDILMVAVIGLFFFTIMYLALITFKDKFFAKTAFWITYVFNALLGVICLFIGYYVSNTLAWAVVYGLFIAGFIFIMKKTIFGGCGFEFADKYKNAAVIFTTWITVLCSSVWLGHLLELVDRDLRKAIFTMFLFILAIVAIKLSTIIQYKSVKKIGYLIIIFTIIKLVLFDLSDLSLIIRSVLFLLIGFFGLIYSKRINKKD